MPKEYSVQELEALRRAVENKYLYGSYSPAHGSGMMSRSYKEAEKAIVVEEQVRTHMMAGHTAKDLIGIER